MSSNDGAFSFQHVYSAADGFVGRMHFPGGLVASSVWADLAEFAEQHGDGFVHLTSRGKVQVRGLKQAPEVRGGAQVLSTPGHAELATLATELAGAVRQDIVIGLDGGHGEILRLRPDIGLVLIDETRMQVVDASLNAGPIVDVAQVNEVVSGIAAAMPPEFSGAAVELPVAVGHSAPIGWLEDKSSELVALGAGVPLGRMDARLSRFLAAIEVDITVTPWHSLYIPNLPAGVAEQVVKVLAPMGLIFDAQSPWLRASACIGAPGCSHALADVRGDLLSAVASGQLEVNSPVYFAGCAKRCGHPRRAHVEYQATAEGDYEIFERS